MMDRANRARSPYQIHFTLTPLHAEHDIRHLTGRAGAPIVVGRSSKSIQRPLPEAGDNARFNCPVVSRTHAWIETHPWASVDEQITIRDRQSMHGTCVNDVMLEAGIPRVLKTGDRIKFGALVERGDVSHSGITVRFARTDSGEPTVNSIQRARERFRSSKPMHGSRGFEVPISSDDDSSSESDYQPLPPAEPVASSIRPIAKKPTSLPGSREHPVDLDDRSDHQAVSAFDVMENVCNMNKSRAFIDSETQGNKDVNTVDPARWPDASSQTAASQGNAKAEHVSDPSTAVIPDSLEDMMPIAWVSEKKDLPEETALSSRSFIPFVPTPVETASGVPADRLDDQESDSVDMSSDYGASSSDDGDPLNRGYPPTELSLDEWESPESDELGSEYNYVKEDYFDDGDLGNGYLDDDIDPEPASGKDADDKPEHEPKQEAKTTLAPNAFAPSSQCIPSISNGTDSAAHDAQVPFQYFWVNSHGPSTRPGPARGTSSVLGQDPWSGRANSQTIPASEITPIMSSYDQGLQPPGSQPEKADDMWRMPTVHESGSLLSARPEDRYPANDLLRPFGGFMDHFDSYNLCPHGGYSDDSSILQQMRSATEKAWPNPPSAPQPLHQSPVSHGSMPSSLSQRPATPPSPQKVPEMRMKIHSIINEDNAALPAENQPETPQSPNPSREKRKADDLKESNPVDAEATEPTDQQRKKARTETAGKNNDGTNSIAETGANEGSVAIRLTTSSAAPRQSLARRLATNAGIVALGVVGTHLFYESPLAEKLIQWLA